MEESSYQNFKQPKVIILAVAMYSIKLHLIINVQQEGSMH